MINEQRTIFETWYKSQYDDYGIDLGKNDDEEESYENYTTDVAANAFQEGERQADAVWVYVTDQNHVLRRGVDMIRGFDDWEVVDGLDGETMLKSGCELCRYRGTK